MAGAIGADVDQLRSLAKQFTRSADQLQQSSTGLSKMIGNAAFWRGNDATMFRSQWQSHSRTSINAAAKTLRAAADVLIRNADEQDQASAAGGGSISSATSSAGRAVAPGTSEVHSAAQNGSNNGGGQTPASSQGGPGVAEPQGGGRDAYLKQVGAPDGHNDGMGAFAGQCTSWAAWRRKELGLPWRVNAGTGTGNGGEMAGRMGGTASTPPSLGAIVSEPGSPGHVMIVEEIYPDGSFRVSEMNVVPPGSTTYTPVAGTVRTDRVWHSNADGTYTFNGNKEYKGKTTPLVIAP
ncbi:CHAP domain-containing protein [Mycobacterium sp. M1]|uniref:CHAP domain-containing protein n=1 Tax=Mycolicibacter acidiphilus TaxID=2835306 RepID=A0ABS5RNK2_9MYCO|nr:CHAP domain-containing protein [Mycolicibacter acidiphilus]MBS9535891.1 CHAP domain-containing protein [Mycolicibacter acidiphilus]